MPRFPAKLTLPAHAFWPLTATSARPAGESIQDVIERTGAALERLAARHAGEDIVIVMHGGTIRAAVAHALGIGPDSALRLVGSEIFP